MGNHKGSTLHSNYTIMITVTTAKAFRNHHCNHSIAILGGTAATGNKSCFFAKLVGWVTQGTGNFNEVFYLC